MKFNFHQKDSITSTLKKSLVAKLMEIAKRENTTFDEAMEALLDVAVEEYFKDVKVEKLKITHKPMVVIGSSGGSSNYHTEVVEDDKKEAEAPEPERENVESPHVADIKKKAWSTRYPECRGCGTTEKKHMGRGFCTTCYFRVDPERQSASVYPKKENPKDFVSAKIQDQEFFEQQSERIAARGKETTCDWRGCFPKDRLFDVNEMIASGELLFCSVACHQDWANDEEL